MCGFLCSKKKQCALYGKWTECLYAIDAANFEAHKKNSKKGASEIKACTEVYEWFYADFLLIALIY